MSRVIVIALLASMGSAASALPLPKLSRERIVIPKTFTANYDFEGIVALDDCSGSLVRLENSKDTDQALVFTNGHCIESGFPSPGTIVSHQPSLRTFELMNSQGDQVGTLSATEVVYSTMTKTDVTIYKLSDTYASIESQYGIRPLTLLSKHPDVGRPIEVVSGYWQRGYSCSIEAFVNQLKEDVFTDQDSIRYSRPGCEVIGGTSGSPIIAEGTRTMIGINNTGNEDGEKCTMNNPCEIDANGNIFYQKGYSYGQETYWVYSCLNASNEIDTSVSGCQLFH